MKTEKLKMKTEKFKIDSSVSDNEDLQGINPLEFFNKIVDKEKINLTRDFKNWNDENKKFLKKLEKLFKEQYNIFEELKINPIYHYFKHNDKMPEISKDIDLIKMVSKKHYEEYSNLQKRYIGLLENYYRRNSALLKSIE